MPKKTKTPTRNKSEKKRVNPLRKIVALIILALSIVSSLVVVTAAYIEHLSPEVQPIPALLGLAFPIFALSTTLLFIVLLLIYPRYSLVSLVALLLSIPAMRQYCPINRGNDRLLTNRPGFSMLTYNTYHFVDVEKEALNDHIDYNRTLQNIINADADIVAIQEKSSLRFKENKRLKFTAEQIEHINQLYPYQILQSRGQILSKYPVRLVSDTIFTKTAFTTVFEADIDGHKVTIINNHLQSIGFTKDDKDLYVELTTRPDSLDSKIGEAKLLTRKLLDAFQQRASQVEAVDSIARSIGGNIILCGDINDTPNSYSYHVLSKNRRDTYLDLGTGPGYTYLANRMWVRIDYLFYEGDMEARYVNVIEKRSSDHYPVYAEFEWK
ncbi:MAG: endonuclease/exonuclease/phosphatase family protein [Bacteroidaceae bacterium]|nr:endonuclease/exonuclease/phosphatase family protein [Bacteroidaceae bacterium]